MFPLPRAERILHLCKISGVCFPAKTFRQYNLFVVIVAVLALCCLFTSLRENNNTRLIKRLAISRAARETFKGKLDVESIELKQPNCHCLKPPPNNMTAAIGERGVERRWHIRLPHVSFVYVEKHRMLI